MYTKFSFRILDQRRARWELTTSPFEMVPPNRSSTESEIAVESRRKTEFTLIFSLKISQGYGILESRALMEFFVYNKKERVKSM